MNFRENLSRSKEVLGAYFRQGLHELGSVFYGHGTAAQHPEYGMIGTRTPGQVADGLRAGQEAGQSQDNAAPSALDAHVSHAQQRSDAERDHEPQRDDPSIERD